MVNACSINQCSDEQWDDFVSQHMLGWITHSSRWKQTLEAGFSHIKGYYFTLTDGIKGKITAGLPVFKVSSFLTGTTLISVPFGTICDPLVSSEDEAEQIIERVIQFAREQNCGHVEIRCLNNGAMINCESLGKTHFFVHHFIRLDAPLEKLWQRFHRTCVMQRIRRAEMSGLEIVRGECRQDLESFYRIYTETRKRIALPPMPYSFLKALWVKFSPDGCLELLLARKAGRNLAGIIIFKFNKRVSIEFAASFERAWNLSPNHLLFWEAIKTAHREGYEIIDFGRTSPNADSLMEFKRRWGTETMTMPHYIYPKLMAHQLIERDKLLKHKVVQLAVKTIPTSVLPKLGNFCYRHLS